MAKAQTTFYLLHGDDELRIEEEADKLRAKLDDDANPGLNLSVFDGSSVDMGEILGAALSYPFLAEHRVVIVKGLIAHITRKGAGNVGKKALETLLAQLPDLPPWTRLVLVETQKLDEKNKLVHLAREHERGSEKLFVVPKDTTQWILKRAQETYQTQIETQAAVALALLTGSDLRAADSELFKLTQYVGGERPIREADVALMTPYVPEAITFDMVDALAEGKTQRAVMLIHRLLEQGEDVFSLYGMIIRQFRLMLLAKEHLGAGGNPKDLPGILGTAPYPAEKAAKQSRGFTIPQLERIYRLLQDYDVRMKTGRIEPKLALDLLVASLGK
ncbi:MAG: DNA polymerase III subunit delta [Chloroflexota bacterium]|nr:DNA polymerase III subunit delta [Chloroflexota bacterium]